MLDGYHLSEGRKTWGTGGARGGVELSYLGCSGRRLHLDAFVIPSRGQQEYLKGKGPMLMSVFLLGYTETEEKRKLDDKVQE